MSRTRPANQDATQNDWVMTHNPAVNVQATISQPAPGVGIRNVVTGLTITLVANSTAPTATVVTVAVIDGATGGTLFLWGPIRMGIAAVAGAMNGIAKSSMWLQGTPNTATTLEFSAAAGANTFESVVMEGTTEVA